MSFRLRKYKTRWNMMRTSKRNKEYPIRKCSRVEKTDWRVLEFKSYLCYMDKLPNLSFLGCKNNGLYLPTA